MERTLGDAASEAALIREAQAGARAAFDRLVAAHATAVVRAAYVIVGDRDEAEDVAQETFLAAYRNIGGYRHDAPFGAWLRRIAVNRGYDHLRRRQRQARLRDDIMHESPASEEDAAVRAAQLNDLSADVRELIAGLDEKNRAIIAMRFLDDMPIKEIAATLDMPEGTIKRRLHDVLTALRSRLAEGAAR